MTLITLRISKLDDYHLSFVLLSIDPSERINHPNFEKTLESHINDAACEARLQITKSLESGSEVTLISAGEILARAVWPDELSAQILKSPAEMLYLDIEEDLIHIPWEFVRIDADFWLGSRFVVGRHVRMPNGQDPSNNDVKKRFVIISDPDGSLPSARLEGLHLLEALGKKRVLTFLSSQVSKSEAAEYIYSCEFFHFAGHSSESGLHFYDGVISAKEILELGFAPRVVFLNSCISGFTDNPKIGSRSIIQALLHNGSLCVICTNGLIVSEHAASFSERFYSEFLSGSSLGKSFKYAYESGHVKNEWVNYTIYGNPLLDLRKSPKKSHKAAKHLGLFAFVCIVFASVFFYFSRVRFDESDLSLEEKVLRGSCDAGSLTSCQSLASSLRRRAKNEEATRISKAACDAGHRASCAEVAIQLLESGDFEKAIDIGKLACSGKEIACFNFIFELKEKNLNEQAENLARDRCDVGQGIGCSIVAQFYDSRGDLNNAIKLHAKACENGYVHSCARHAVKSIEHEKNPEKLNLLQSYCDERNIDGACQEYGEALVIFNRINEAVEAFDRECNDESRSGALSCEAAGAILLERNQGKYAKEYLKKACDFGRASACAKFLSESAENDDNPCGTLSYSECRELGYQHQKKNNLAIALTIYEYLCDRKFFSACNDAGIVANKKNDLARAENHFRVACSADQKYSCENLADILEGSGKKQEAIKITDEACKRGIGGACFKAYYLLEKTKESTKPIELLERGCELGHPASCNDYGFFMNKSPDKTKSIFAYTKACTDGFTRSCLNLGNLYSDIGKFSEAITWYSHGCSAGNVTGCDLRDLVEIQELRKLKRNDDAFKRMQKYCDDTRADGCFDLGEIALELSDKEKASEAFLKSCHAHDYDGCAKYGELQLAEDKSDVAFEYCSKACKGGHQDGCKCQKKATKKSKLGL